MWVNCRASADPDLGSEAHLWRCCLVGLMLKIYWVPIKSPLGFWPKGLALRNGFCALLFSLGFRTFGSTTAGLDAFIHGGEWFEIRGGFVARAVLVVADVVFGLLHSGFGICGFGCWCC